MDGLLNIIYTKSGMFLSKKHYANWREVQNDFEDYQASFEAWSSAEVIEYLNDEYPKLEPSAAEQITAFLANDATLVQLFFAV